MGTKPKILIVDDEPYNIDYLAQEIEDLGYEPLSARNGLEALKTVEADSPDMILLDIMMPVMDGFEVLSRLKAERSWQHIPVVIISAMSDMASIVKGIGLGAEDFLSKPFEPVLLNARLKACLEKKHLRDLEQDYLRELERELEIGREIQAGFLPEKITQPEGWEIATFFQAAREVAGDFYDVFDIPGDKLGLILGDVVDKGVGAALYMALFRSLLRAAFCSDMLSDTFENPAKSESDCVLMLKKAVTLTNRYICRTHHSASFATLFFGVLDLKTGSMCFIVAGHERPLVIGSGQVKQTLNSTGPLVGMFDDVVFRVDKFQLEAGDILLIYSDGILDAKDDEGEMFEQDRFLSLLDRPNPTASSLLDHIVSNVKGFVGDAEQYDDITLMAVRRH